GACRRGYAAARPQIRHNESPAKRNAPSRWRLRPAFRPTSAEAVAYRRTLNLGRSVLSAVATLRTHALQVKRPARRFSCNLQESTFVGAAHGFASSKRGFASRKQERYRARPSISSPTKKCTDPSAPSSGFPTDLRRSGCLSENPQPRTLRT